jgi:hypothetical protein
MKYTGKAIFVLGMLFAGLVYSAPVAYWRFENSGVSQYNSPALDLTLGSGAGYSVNVPNIRILNGIGGSVVTNTACYSSGTGYARTTNYALLNSAVEATSHGFTVESFVYLPTGVGVAWDEIVGSSGGWYLTIWSDGRLAFDGKRGSDGAEQRAFSAAAIAQGAWHHLAAVGTYNQNSGGNPYLVVSLYVDYVQSGTAAVMSAAAPGSPCLSTLAGDYIAGYYNGNPWLLDELRISDTALTPNQFLRATNTPVSCEEVQQFGYGLDEDLNADCYVDFSDVAVFAQDWLKCNDPEDVNCN